VGKVRKKVKLQSPSRAQKKKRKEEREEEGFCRTLVQKEEKRINLGDLDQSDQDRRGWVGGPQRITSKGRRREE